MSTSIHTLLLLLLLTAPYYAISSCSKDCTPDDAVKVLIQTSGDEGKANALNCSVAIEGHEPLIIQLGDGYIVGTAICESDKQSLSEAPGIDLIEDDQVVSIANETDVVTDVQEDTDVDVENDADTSSNNCPTSNTFYLFTSQIFLASFLILTSFS